jgi:hypothetical protein
MPLNVNNPSDDARKPLPRQVFDEMWGDDLRREG